MAFLRAQEKLSSPCHLLNHNVAHRVMLTAMDQYMSSFCKQTDIQVQIAACGCKKLNTVRHGEA